MYNILCIGPDFELHINLYCVYNGKPKKMKWKNYSGITRVSTHASCDICFL